MSSNKIDTGDSPKSPVSFTNKNNGEVIYSCKDGMVIRKNGNHSGGLYDSRNKCYKDSECR